MQPKIPFALTVSACLLAACGRVGDDVRLPPPAALARAQPAAAAPSPQPEAPAPRVQMPTADALTDAAITNRISAEIQGDPSMQGADVSINTDKGVVVLSGTVKTHEQTGVASAHAQRQDGVLRVDNHLRPEYS
jgi:hyperosmotically inducible protein